MFENLPDNGYEFAEEIEVHETAKERLLWMKRGFDWCYKMTDKQKDVVFYKLFSEKTQKEIGNILHISQQMVSKHWKYAMKKGKLTEI